VYFSVGRYRKAIANRPAKLVPHCFLSSKQQYFPYLAILFPTTVSVLHLKHVLGSDPLDTTLNCSISFKFHSKSMLI